MPDWLQLGWVPSRLLRLLPVAPGQPPLVAPLSSNRVNKNMAFNPPLVQAQNALFPAPYTGEYIALGRDGVEVKVEGVRTSSGK